MSEGLGYEPSDDPAWDDMRSRTWDLYDEGMPLTDLDTVLGLIGAGNEPPEVQRQILAAWMKTAAYVPAPPELKEAAEEFLRGEGSG